MNDISTQKNPNRWSISVRTLLVVVTVTAVSAACFGGLINASLKSMEQVLLYIPVTAAAPLALMVFLHYVLKFGDWLNKPRQSRNHLDR